MSNNNQPPHPPKIQRGTKLYYVSDFDKLPYTVTVTKVNKKTFSTSIGRAYYLEPTWSEYKQEYTYTCRNRPAFGAFPAVAPITPEVAKMIKDTHRAHRLRKWLREELPAISSELTPDQIQQIKTLAEGFENKNKTE